MEDLKKSFIKEAEKSFAEICKKAVDIGKSFEEIKNGKGEISLKVYKGDKVEKVIFSSIKIFKLAVVEESLMVWPTDEYNFPVLWCNLTSMSGMNIAICDYMPLADLTIWSDYISKYFEGFQRIKREVMKELKNGIEEELNEISSIVICALSPYRIILNLKDEGVDRFIFQLKKFYSDYLSLINSSKNIDGDDKDFSIRKKEALKKLMKQNDPGYPIMANAFGNELTDKVFDIIF